MDEQIKTSRPIQAVTEEAKKPIKQPVYEYCCVVDTNINIETMGKIG